MRGLIGILCAAALLAAADAPTEEWSPQPWLEDLAQVREAFDTKYANKEWLERDRGVPLPALFDRVAARLRSGDSDAEARAVFERLVQRIGDGHVEIHWANPAPAGGTAGGGAGRGEAAPADICKSMGYQAGRASGGIAPHLAGYQAVGSGDPFPTGIVPVGAARLGLIRIGLFDPKASPSLCTAALQALRMKPDAPCDEACQDRVLTWTYARMTAALEERIRALSAAGATMLMVDLTDNGGGSEWAEAAARIVSPRPITSEPVGFVRGAHWAEQWKTLSSQLRNAAKSASAGDRTRLLGWAAEADRAKADAEAGCAGQSNCSLVARAGYATGLVGRAKTGDFEGRDWGVYVFSPAQFPYHDSVWTGPLAVLVDDETWSAAEEFAAVLQDNKAAVIVGTRTGGAGCGHTAGGTPTTLKNSGAVLELPDCVRFRADGSNEVAGVIPDVLVGMRANDGPAFKAKLIGARLGEAVQLAERQRGAGTR